MPEPLDRNALDELREMTGGDATLYVELLDTFLSDADLYLGELRAAADATALARAAHSLKSNAMTVGATELAARCRELEADARAGDVGDREQRVEEIGALLLVARAAVTHERNAASGGAPGDG
ncbi:MAG: Hpt domain-containing protein [Chloroflexota bacterium]|nr:Hpt domain-containing protein [Chloroflexota bacterium]